MLAGCGVLAPPGLAEALFVFLINPEAVEAEPDFIALIRLLVSATGVILLRGPRADGQKWRSTLLDIRSTKFQLFGKL